MQDVIALLRSLVSGDSVLQAQMGGTPTDNRMYPFYNPNAAIDTSHPAYLTYNLLTYGEAGGRVRQPIFRVTIWALHSKNALDVRDSLVRIFDKKKKTTAAPTSRIIYLKQIYETDVPPESTGSSNYYGIITDFRIGYEDAGVATSV